MVDEVLQVVERSGLGSGKSRRLRRNGHIPAILYGHGEQNVCLSLPADQFHAVLRHGSQMVQLQGAVNENALIRDIQWDAFGSEVLHVDLTRVRAGEKVEVTVPLELRGVAPGTREGGQVQQLTHDLEVRCPAGSIPEHLEVNINDLQLDASIHVADVPVPSDVEVLTDPNGVVVQCLSVEVPEEVEEGAAGELAEPEVIRRREEEEAGDER